MDASQLTHILQELHFSAGLPPEVLEPFAAASMVQQVAAGTVLFREGSSNKNLYLIRSGRIALEMTVPGRGAIRILTLGPGEMAGWSALLAGGKMTTSAVAVQDSELIVTAAQELHRLSEQNPGFGYNLMRQLADALSKRLVATRLQLLDLFADSPPVIPDRETGGPG